MVPTAPDAGTATPRLDTLDAPAPWLAWTNSAAARLAVLTAVVVGVAYNLVGFPGLRKLGDYYRLDLDVYRIGGTALANGVPLYGALPMTALGKPLPFTYPPLAAIVFSPMSALSLEHASLALTAVSLVLLLGTILLTLRSLGLAGRDTVTWAAGALFAGALLLEPVYSTLDYGQVNIALMALVAADCLLPRTPWPRGLLVGLVAAVKLTPAVFVLFFLLRKDFRAAVMTGVGFLGGAAVGFLVSFSDAKTYWTETLVDSGRIGLPAYPANQSFTGMLARLGLDPAVRTPVWVLACLLTLAVTVVAVRRSLGSQRPALALTATAVFGLLASPVSWSHHWVWVVPMLMVFGHLALGRTPQPQWQRALWASWTLAGIALFVIAPHWRLTPGRTSGLDWPLWDQFLASSYVWWGLASLVLVAVVRLAPAGTGRPTAAAPARDDALAPAS
ncbi:glycosyltransferase 87 family protein [Rhodococcus kronopolitis]|uniref:Glycosyltransferase 87 family protein n=1 Tax=Rhodococcus kronopolitis TaxID=1460226 RepID=A0ABV9FKB4_9NOCA